MSLKHATAALIACLLLTACEAQSTPNGQVARGAELIADNGCGLCHSIPGITGADGEVGPPLDGIARRVYIAGKLRNSPENLARWIENPQAIDPGNVMPDMHLNPSQARAVAAYLDTLE
jgi:cytochrome c2